MAGPYFSWLELAIPLGSALVLGSVIGAERQWRQRTAGLRTYSLVSVGAALFGLLAPLTGVQGESTRVAAQVISGVGFLGAGVIVHAGRHFRVRGLTSAACTWLAACIGIVCGLGQWRLVTVALVMTFAVLTVGNRVERWLHKRLGGKEVAEQQPLPVASSDELPK